MSERDPSEANTLELALLWDTAVDVLRAQAYTVGIRTNIESLDGLGESVAVVLTEELQPGDIYTFSLWAEPVRDQLIGRVMLAYTAPNANDYLYEITPEGIVQYSKEPTLLDNDDIRSLREDLIDTNWSKKRSQRSAAKKPPFIQYD